VAVSPQLSICIGGIGASGAQASCESLLAMGATALVSWGVAAGLDPRLASGTLVIAWQLARQDDAAPAPLTVTADASRRWADRVTSRLTSRVHVARGSIASADEMLQTVADKRNAARTGAVAADMETGGVARVAQSAGVPWLAFRAIADTADVALPASVLHAVDHTGRVRAGHLARGLVRHPEELLQLPGLARGFRAALRALKAAAHEAGPTLLAPEVTGDEGTPTRAECGATA
jgi:adenosylhomocysteine nucleosidase